MLILAPDTLTILQASANIAELAGSSPDGAAGQPLSAITGKVAAGLVARAVDQARSDVVGPLDCRVAAPARTFNGWLHGHWGAGGLILEIEPSPRSSDAANVLAGVGGAIRRYRSAQDVVALAGAVAEDMLRLTGFDRAIVLRMGHALDQQPPLVIAAKGRGALPGIGAPFLPHVISAEARAMLELNRIRVVADRMAPPIGFVPALNPVTGLAPDLSRAGLRSPLERVTRALEVEGARSLMTVSLMTAGRLWGVIWCDSGATIRLSPATRAICEAMGEIAAAQISTLEERETASRRMRATRTLGRLSAALRLGDDIAATLSDQGAALTELFAPDAWLAAVDGTTRTSGDMPPAARWLALLDGDGAVRGDGTAHAVSPDVGAVLRIDVTLGGQLLLLRRTARPWLAVELESAQELHRILVDRHTELYRAKTELKLHRLAFYDPVTDLPNRAYLLQEMQRTMATGGDAALLVLNLDRFKALKGSLGEETSDGLLAVVARRLEGCISENDRLARTDTGAFAVLLTGERAADSAAMLSFAVKEALKAPVSLAGREIFVTASQGLVPSARVHGLAADVLRNAEIAAYEAETGGGGAKHFDSAMRAKLTERYELYDKLRHAIYFGGAIKTAYQPIIDLEAGDLCGFEVLARWEDPERGHISPADFIPVAEETGLIVPLGNQVLVQACRNIAAWNRARLDADPSAPPVTVSVNLSPFQLDPGKLDLVRWVKGVMQLTGADPSWLVLEITESGLIANAGSALDVLHQLRDLGVQLAIDDFGTGYSSLSYLQRLPVGTLKIDRSFVAGMDSGRQGVEMVRTIVQLAKIMNFSVTAEGVETDRQMALLRNLGCRRGQGWLFAKPLPPDEARRVAAGEKPWSV